jgi:2,4-dienoyl-CoA reductase-like NADH-dependent reductase (Old Yellow Enzyme family)
MGTGLVESGHLSARDVAFQEERARAGVGLIVTGAAVVHPTSLFPVRIIVEAWDEDGSTRCARGSRPCSVMAHASSASSFISAASRRAG